MSQRARNQDGIMDKQKMEEAVEIHDAAVFRELVTTGKFQSRYTKSKVFGESRTNTPARRHERQQIANAPAGGTRLPNRSTQQIPRKMSVRRQTRRGMQKGRKGSSALAALARPQQRYRESINPFHRSVKPAQKSLAMQSPWSSSSKELKINRRRAPTESETLDYFFGDSETTVSEHAADADPSYSENETVSPVSNQNAEENRDKDGYVDDFSRLSSNMIRHPSIERDSGRASIESDGSNSIVGRPTSDVIRELTSLIGNRISAKIKRKPTLPPRKKKNVSTQSRRRSTSILRFLSSKAELAVENPLFELEEEIPIEKRISLSLPLTSEQFEEELDPVGWEEEAQQKREEELATVRMNQLEAVLHRQEAEKSNTSDKNTLKQKVVERLQALHIEPSKLDSTSVIAVDRETFILQVDGLPPREQVGEEQVKVQEPQVSLSIYEALKCMGLLPERAEICSRILESEGVDLLELKLLSEQDFIDLGVALGDRRKILRNRDALVSM